MADNPYATLINKKKATNNPYVDLIVKKDTEEKSGPVQMGEDIIGGIKKLGGDIKANLTGQTQAPQDEGILSRTIDRFGNAGQKIAQDITDFSNNGGFSNNGNTNSVRLLEHGLTHLSQPITGTIGDVVGSAVKTVATDKAEQQMSDIMNSEPVRYIGDKLNEGFKAAIPNEGDRQFLTEAFNYAPIPVVDDLAKSVLKGLKYVPEGGQTLSEGIKTGAENLGKGIVSKVTPNAEKLNKYADDLIYEAVNPTKLENKIIVKQRAEDLKTYLSDNPFKNDLEIVKNRVDADMKKAGEKMNNYEENIGVKGKLETDPIIVKLQDKYFETVNGQLINPSEAKIAQELIDTLEGFGPVVTDGDIIKVRRSWDKIEKANKGFMQSADANAKGEIFGDANKFFREEIHKSNPEYSQYLKEYHKTRTLSDVLEATINRKTGQTNGGFIRRGFENLARIGGITGGGALGNPLLGWLGAEAIIRGTEAVSSPGFKLTIAKILANLKKNGIPDNIRVNSDDGILQKQVGLISSNFSVAQRIINSFKNGTINAENTLAELMRKAQKGLVTQEELVNIAKENPDIAQLMLKADREETILEVIKSVENEIKLRPQRIENFKEEIKKGIESGQYTDEDLIFMIDNTKSPEIKKTIQNTIQELETPSLKAKTEKKVKAKTPTDNVRTSTETVPAKNVPGLAEDVRMNEKGEIEPIPKMPESISIKGEDQPIPKQEPVKATEAPEVKIEPTKTNDQATIQQIENSIQEGELILRTGMMNGKKLSPEGMQAVRMSVENAKKKIGVETVSSPGSDSYKKQVLTSDEILNGKITPDKLTPKQKKAWDKAVKDGTAEFVNGEYKNIKKVDKAQYGIIEKTPKSENAKMGTVKPITDMTKNPEYMEYMDLANKKNGLDRATGYKPFKMTKEEMSRYEELRKKFVATPQSKSSLPMAETKTPKMKVPKEKPYNGPKSVDDLMVYHTYNGYEVQYKGNLLGEFKEKPTQQQLLEIYNKVNKK